MIEQIGDLTEIDEDLIDIENKKQYRGYKRASVLVSYFMWAMLSFLLFFAGNPHQITLTQAEGTLLILLPAVYSLVVLSSGRLYSAKVFGCLGIFAPLALLGFGWGYKMIGASITACLIVFLLAKWGGKWGMYDGATVGPIWLEFYEVGGINDEFVVLIGNSDLGPGVSEDQDGLLFPINIEDVAPRDEVAEKMRGRNKHDRINCKITLEDVQGVSGFTYKFDEIIDVEENDGTSRHRSAMDWKYRWENQQN